MKSRGHESFIFILTDGHYVTYLRNNIIDISVLIECGIQIYKSF